MKPLLKLQNHETKDFQYDRLHNSKVEAEVWPLYIVDILIVSNKRVFFTFYNTNNLPDIGLWVILDNMYKDFYLRYKINIFIFIKIERTKNQLEHL